LMYLMQLLGYAKFRQMNELIKVSSFLNYLGHRLTQCFASFRMANCSYALI
jgi:hypothetical protein